MQFQNTIAYAQLYNVGGEMNNLESLTYKYFPFPAISSNIGTLQNINVSSDSEFKAYVEQTGAYFIDFSFISDSGDSRQYKICPFIDGVQQSEELENLFFQQPSGVKYEVSANWILNLTQGQEIAVKLEVFNLPTVTFFTRDIKMSIFNLQQLGIH